MHNLDKIGAEIEANTGLPYGYGEEFVREGFISLSCAVPPDPNIALVDKIEWFAPKAGLILSGDTDREVSERKRAIEEQFRNGCIPKEMINKSDYDKFMEHLKNKDRQNDEKRRLKALRKKRNKKKKKK